MSALAVRTHKPLPPHQAPPLTILANCDAVPEMRRRVLGETMSRRARTRSDMVSDGKADGMRELVEREESAEKGVRKRWNEGREAGWEAQEKV